jgi:hypothetical protein
MTQGSSQGPDTPPIGEVRQAPIPPQGPVQQQPYLQQPHVQQPWAAPAAPRPAGPATGPGLAVVALILGFFGAVVWLLPINEDGVRHYLPFPFALAGLVLGIVGLIGNRQGKPMAVIGIILSVIALLLGIFMVGLEFIHHLGL